MRIVLDTNIIVSAAFGGIPLEAIHCASHYTIYISDEIEKELYGVIGKLANRISPQVFEELKRQINIIIRITKKIKSKKSIKIKICRDPKDNAYLELAKLAKADILVTGDKDLLSLTLQDLKRVGLRKLNIITPRELIQQYTDFF